MTGRLPVHRARIGHGGKDLAARCQPLAHQRENAHRVGHMLQHMAQHDGVEGLRGLEVLEHRVMHLGLGKAWRSPWQ